MNPVNWHFETDLEYLTTIPIHYLDLLTNVTKTRITETPSFRIANGCLIWQIHIQSFQSISIITSLCQRTGIIIPHLSPLPYSIRYHKPHISFYWFLLLSIIQSFIVWWIIDFQTGIVWFFAFIDSISFADKEYGYRFW